MQNIKILYGLFGAPTNVDEPSLLSLWSKEDNAKAAEVRANAEGQYYTYISIVAVDTENIYDEAE